MIKKLLIAVVALVVLVVLGLQLFLQYGLTEALKKYILPAAKERLQVDAALEGVSVNLLAGSFTLRGLQVINPSGFQEPTMLALRRCRVKIGIPALFRGGLTEIRKAELKNASLTVERNKAGALNIAPLLSQLAQAEPAAAPPAAATSMPPAASKTLPDIIIKMLEIKTLFRYIDHQLLAEPFRLALELRVQMKDIANYGNEEVLSGSLNVQGILRIAEQQCAFDLQGRIAPIIDPQRLSCELSGSMQEIDLQAFEPLIGQYGITGGTVHGTAAILCHQGRFDPDKSLLRLTFNQIQVSAEKQAQIPGGRLPKSLQLVVPLKGTLNHPEIDLGGLIQQTLFSPDMFEAVLKDVLHDQIKSGGAAEPLVGEVLKKTSTSSPDKVLDLNKALQGVFGK